MSTEPQSGESGHMPSQGLRHTMLPAHLDTFPGIQALQHICVAVNICDTLSGNLAMTLNGEPVVTISPVYTFADSFVAELRDEP